MKHALRTTLDKRRWRAGWLMVLWLLPARLAHPAAPVASQIQVARRFLLAVLQGEFEAARHLLAPEVGQAVSAERFRAAVLPLYRQGQRFGPAIELYKFGYRLSEGQQARPFVAFTFKGDTLNARPQTQLDVVFRDTTTRQVLSFGLLPLGKPVR